MPGVRTQTIEYLGTFKETPPVVADHGRYLKTSRAESQPQDHPAREPATVQVAGVGRRCKPINNWCCLSASALDFINIRYAEPRTLGNEARLDR